MIDRAEALQPIACEIMLADFSDCDAHPNELRQEGHVFSRHFRQTGDSQDQPTGLRALVAAADVAVQDQIRSNVSGFATDVSVENPMNETSLQPRFPGTLTRMEGMEQHLFGPTPSRNVNVAQSSNLQHAAVSATTSQGIEPGMANNNLYEQNRSSQWRPCDLSWPQDPAVLNSQFNNIMGPEVAHDGDRYTSIEGSWDWDSMIQETYAHLGDGFTG